MWMPKMQSNVEAMAVQPLLFDGFFFLPFLSESHSALTLPFWTIPTLPLLRGMLAATAKTKGCVCTTKLGACNLSTVLAVPSERSRKFDN
jgi:hypothetical protein